MSTCADSEYHFLFSKDIHACAEIGVSTLFDNIRHRISSATSCYSRHWKAVAPRRDLLIFLSVQSNPKFTEMDTGFLNSLVADYLSSVSSKLAEKFKKETKSSPLPAGSPGIAEMVKHYKENTPKASKRKLDMTNGNSPAKKTKKVRILNRARGDGDSCMHHICGI